MDNEPGAQNFCAWVGGDSGPAGGSWECVAGGIQVAVLALSKSTVIPGVQGPWADQTSRGTHTQGQRRKRRAGQTSGQTERGLQEGEIFQRSGQDGPEPGGGAGETRLTRTWI